ncbi:hypothetical protein MNBD_ALPHA12-792 [hydrothermal vent metagenome]|uniref:Protein PsiE n=1 Tax=hydrothermal vent metagenome TaxID=652676 RepID=A0A3B0UM42_9ZZZZ
MTDPNNKGAPSPISRFDTRFSAISNDLGNLLVHTFHKLALFAIGLATVWAFFIALFGMFGSNEITVEDLLLLFIYLEIGAMVGIYFKTTRMPVRFLVYVAITALTRLLISIANFHEQLDVANVHENLDALYILMISGGILLLALAVLVIRFGSSRFPSNSSITINEEDA